MKRKIKYLTAILLFVFLFYSIKKSYARFTTQVEGELNSSSTGIQFAKFVFNGNITDTLNFEINDLMPGDTKDITFSVTNYNANGTSDVKIVHKVTMTSYMLPLEFNLYRNNAPTTNVFTCTGTIGKDCESSEYTMNYTSNSTINYVLRITYPSTSPAALSTFVNGIDTITIELDSWQKTS